MKWRHCAASPIKKRRAVRSRPARSLSTGLRTIVRRSATTAAAESPAVPVSTLRRFSFMTVSALFPFFLRQARLHYPFQQSGRQRLVQREVDGAFGGGVVLEFVLERFDHSQTSGEQTAMVRKGGVPHDRSFVLEGRNPIADSLGGFRWQSRSNRRAHLVQRAAGGFRDGGQVSVDGRRRGGGFCGGTARAGGCFLHRGNKHEDNLTASKAVKLELGISDVRREKDY